MKLTPPRWPAEGFTDCIRDHCIQCSLDTTPAHAATYTCPIWNRVPSRLFSSLVYFTLRCLTLTPAGRLNHQNSPFLPFRTWSHRKFQSCEGTASEEILLRSKPAEYATWFETSGDNSSKKGLGREWILKFSGQMFLHWLLATMCIMVN